VSGQNYHKYLIDKILPARRPHLLAGISSAGKSRFIIPAFMMYSAGMPVLGLESHPERWCIVGRDRPLGDVQDTIQSIGFNLNDVDIIPAFGQHSKPLYQIMGEIEDLGAKLVLWEGFDMMVRNPNNPHEVGEFLSTVTAYCEKGLTVLGTVGVAKLKPHEMYQNPRQLVAGSSIWERATGTNFIIVATNPRDIGDSHRLLYVSLKNEASFAVGGQFDDNGILVFDDYEMRHRGADLAQNIGHSKKSDK
jgi:hypothetical protein